MEPAAFVKQPSAAGFLRRRSAKREKRKRKKNNTDRDRGYPRRTVIIPEQGGELLDGFETNREGIVNTPGYASLPVSTTSPAEWGSSRMISPTAGSRIRPEAGFLMLTTGVSRVAST